MPKAIAEGHNLSEGTDLEILECADGLLLTAVSKGVDFDELVSRITKKNRHSEVATGTEVGKEVW